LTYGKTTVNPRHKKNDKSTPLRLDSEPIVVEKAFEGIISDELFETANRRMKERTALNPSPRTASSAYLLSGIARCGKCGYMMAGNTSGRGNKVQYYMCNGHRSKMSSCGARAIRRGELDDEVLKHVRAAFSVENRTALIERAKERYHVDVNAARSSLAVLESELNEVSRAKSRWLADYERGVIDGSIVNTRVGELNEREQALTRNIAEARQSLRAAESKLASVDDSAINRLASDFDAWDVLDVEQKKSLFRRFVERVEVYKGDGDEQPELTITLRTDIEG
jgi:site-specific DNA recombinase